MGRFTYDSFTTPSVGAGATLDFDRVLSSHYVDIYLISITPSLATNTSEFSVFNTAARADADLIYKTSAWDDAAFVDPIEDSGGIYTARNEGFVCRYEDTEAELKLHCRIKNNHSSPKTYDIIIAYEESPFGANLTGVPDGLEAAGASNGLSCLSGVLARYNNATIDEAEFRAKFYADGSVYPTYVDMSTAAEGGSFTHNGTTQLIITGLTANSTGSQYRWTSGAHGRWFFVWKLHNSVGWSHWSDGNETPIWVTQFFDTSTLEDTGPPEDWQVTLEKGPYTGSYIVKVTRPKVNGNIIYWWSAQIKNSSTGSWRSLDANAGAAITKYDGSGANHVFDPATGKITTPGSWGTAAVGDLILYDVRGTGVWTLEHCLWATVAAISGLDITIYGGGGHLGLLPTATFAGGKYTQVRLKIVKPPWDWTTEGYLGAQPNRGFFEGGGAVPLLDRATKQFSSAPILIPTAIAEVQARVWFQNGYSRSDDGLTVSNEIVGGPGIIGQGYVWNSFNDRDWWIPSMIGLNNLLYTLNNDGTVTLSSIGSSAYPEFGSGGVIGRFSVFPNTSGIVKLRAKFTCNFPLITVSGAKSMVGIFIDMPGSNPVQYATDIGVHAICCQNATKAGPLPILYIAHFGSFTLSDFQSIGRNSSVSATIDPATTSPFDVELRLTIDEDITNLIKKRIVWKVYEYQINGGGWNTITMPAPAETMYPRSCANAAIRGFRPSLHFYQEGVMAGAYAILKEFEVVNGLIVKG